MSKRKAVAKIINRVDESVETTGEGRIFAYVRVSTDLKDASGDYEQSFDSQINEIRKRYPKINDKNIYRDRLSGSDFNRPELNKLMEMVQSGDKIVFFRLDRLGRSTVAVINIVNELVQSGVTVEFVNENLTFSSEKNNPMSQFTLTLLSAFAELERSIIRERVIAGVKSAQARGIHCGRPGISKNKKALIVNFAHNGLSVPEIAKEVVLSTRSVQRVLKEKELTGITPRKKRGKNLHGVDSQTDNFQLDGGRISKKEKAILFNNGPNIKR